jgi:hypothetical protein
LIRSQRIEAASQQKAHCEVAAAKRRGETLFW